MEEKQEKKVKPQTQFEMICGVILNIMIQSPPQRIGLFIIRKKLEAYKKYPALTIAQQYRAMRLGIKKKSPKKGRKK